MDKMMRNYYRLFLIYVLSHLMPFQLGRFGEGLFMFCYSA